MGEELSEPGMDEPKRGGQQISLEGIDDERYAEIHGKVLEVMKESNKDDTFNDLLEQVREIPEDDDEVERDVAMFALGYYYVSTQFIRSAARMRSRRR